MVKPDAVQHLGKILDAISQAGFILRCHPAELHFVALKCSACSSTCSWAQMHGRCFIANPGYAAPL